MRHSDLKKALGLFGYFFSAYPGRSSVMILAMLLAAATEGLGIAALLPLLRIATNADEAAQGAISRWVDQGFAWVGLSPSIGNLLILVTVAIALKSLLVFLAMREVGTTAARVAMDLRLDLAGSLMQARWLFYVRQRLGSLAAALTSEPGRASAGYVAACRLLVALIQAAAFCAVAASISWQVTAIAMATGLIGFPILAGFVRVSARAGQANTHLSRRFFSRLVESLSGIKAIKAMAGEERLGSYLEADIRALNEVQRRLIVSREGLAQIQEPLKVVALAIALYILLGSWANGLEALAVLAILFSRAVQRIQQVQRHYQELTQHLPAFGFIRAVTRRAQAARESLAAGQTLVFEDHITFHGVSFGYDRKTVLDRIDLTIPAGKMVGIVGASGVGKTTIADLVIGLLRPTAGHIEVDGTPLDQVDLKAWRHMIGYVPQETLLFHDTVRTNLTLGDTTLTREQAETALRRAGAWEFVAALPNGLDSMIGEKGTALSGGQRQRLAIARALIRDPALLILDEATTALDPRTEEILCQTLRQLLPSVTILAISHQTTMVEVADIVYRLDERGLTPEAMLAGRVRAEATVP